MDLGPGAYRGQPPETPGHTRLRCQFTSAIEKTAFNWDGSLTAKGHKSYVVQCGAGRQSRRMSLKAG
jgi:hypothetical protein